MHKNLSFAHSKCKFGTLVKLAAATLFLVALSQIYFLHPAVAQDESTKWTDPVRLNLYGKTTGTWFVTPAIATADQYGYVHIFWHEQSDPNVIVYARANGEGPPKVIDILPSDNGVPITTFIDKQSNLHLSWTTNGMDFSHKMVPVSDALDARMWMAAPETAPPGAVKPGADGAWYALSRTLDTAFLAMSTDQGRTWSDKRLLAEADNPGWVLNFDYLVDTTGRIHVVWTSAIKRGVPDGQKLYYYYSDDHGLSWSEPVVLDSDDDRYADGYAPWTQKLSLDSKGRIHLIWNGAPAGQRHYRYTDDRGLTWSNDQQIWSDLRGITGKNNLSEDSRGRLHMITGSLSWGLYHAYLENSVWSRPLSIHPDIGDAEGHISLITRGNHLHAIWANVIETHDVWYASTRLNTPEIAVAPLPTHIVTRPAQTPTSIASSPAQGSPTLAAPVTPSRPFQSSSPPYRKASQNAPIGVAMIAVIVVMILSVGIHHAINRR